MKTNAYSIFISAAALFGILTSMPVSADIPLSSTVDFIGDLRAGYYSAQRDDRDATEEEHEQLIGRVRGGLSWKPSAQVSGTARLAGRYSTLDNNPHFEIFESIPDTDGLRAGDATADELFIKYNPSSRWEVLMGRLQTAFELAGVAAGSLDRSDSPNTDITWTDGAHIRYAGSGSWNWHLILQYNASEGATNVRLPPLTFEDPESRVSYFAALENLEPYGPIVQRTLDINYLPSALNASNEPSSRIEDYCAFVARLAAQWPVGSRDTKLLIGTELGFALNTPDKATVGTGTSGSSGGLAWQVQLSIADFVPGHSFALQHGRADAGWLISPDFRNNEVLSEVRYEWSIDENQTFTARARRRDDMDLLTDATQKRRDEDVFLRYSYKF